MESGLIQPLQGNVEGLKCISGVAENFICTQGSGSIVKHFLKTAGDSITASVYLMKIAMLITLQFENIFD